MKNNMTTKKGFNDQVSFATYDKIAIPEAFKGLSFTPEDIQVLAQIVKLFLDFFSTVNAQDNEAHKTTNELYSQAYKAEIELQKHIIDSDLPPESKVVLCKDSDKKKEKILESKKETDNAFNVKNAAIWTVVGFGLGATFLGLSRKR
jgi:hypothetical protein